MTLKSFFRVLVSEGYILYVCVIYSRVYNKFIVLCTRIGAADDVL